MSELAQLATLVLTARLGSLAAVSKELGISVAAVSKQLTRLEQHLGIQLLERTTRRVFLTEAGLSYCLQCERILEEVDIANSLIGEIKAQPSGRLKVVSGRHFAATYIVPHLVEFLEKYPKVKLHLELAERLPDINNEDIDVLIGMSMPASGNIIQRRIATTTYVLCAAPAYLKKYGTPQTFQELANHRYIGHSMRKVESELVNNKGRHLNVSPYMQVNDAEAMVQLALAGMGIAKLHEYVVRKYLAKGVLCELLSDEFRSDLPLYVAYPERRYLPTKIRLFIDFAVSKMQTD